MVSKTNSHNTVKKIKMIVTLIMRAFAVREYALLGRNAIGEIIMITALFRIRVIVTFSQYRKHCMLSLFTQSNISGIRSV